MEIIHLYKTFLNIYTKKKTKNDIRTGQGKWDT